MAVPAVQNGCKTANFVAFFCELAARYRDLLRILVNQSYLMNPNLCLVSVEFRYLSNIRLQFFFSFLTQFLPSGTCFGEGTKAARGGAVLELVADNGTITVGKADG